MNQKYVVCYSGGHSSALAAIEAVRKYEDDVILLNHDINPKVEHEDIKRFKQEVADYLGIKITYANDPELRTPLQVCRDKKAFQVETGQALCTHELKTKPFMQWIHSNFPADAKHLNGNVKVLYGFDKNEGHRIQRRTGIMINEGYFTDYPLAFGERTITDTRDIGIEPPRTYKVFKHANCVGCLKAGMQHWYVVYCLRPDIYTEGIRAEEIIGYSIIKDNYLEELVEKFEYMKTDLGICPNDRENSASFWAKVEKHIPGQGNMFPCECSLY